MRLMDWRALYFGRVSPSEVQESVADASWQQLRRSMKGQSLEMKYSMLDAYYQRELERLHSEHAIRLLQVRVTNYVTALSRGGLISPKDYR